MIYDDDRDAADDGSRSVLNMKKHQKTLQVLPAIFARLRSRPPNPPFCRAYLFDRYKTVENIHARTHTHRLHPDTFRLRGHLFSQTCCNFPYVVMFELDLLHTR